MLVEIGRHILKKVLEEATLEFVGIEYQREEFLWFYIYLFFMQNSLREQRISSELEELREEAFVEVNECMVNGLSREDFWVVWVKDQNEYIEGEVYYPVRI